MYYYWCSAAAADTAVAAASSSFSSFPFIFRLYVLHIQPARARLFDAYTCVFVCPFFRAALNTLVVVVLVVST